MSSEKNILSFYLNVLEVSGKQITNTYVNDLRIYMDKKGLKYKFEIITDEDFYIADRPAMTGGKTTFPYSHFENAFNRVGNMLSFDNANSSSNRSDTVLDLNIETKNYGDIEPVTVTPSKSSTNDESNKSDRINRDTTLRDTIVDTLLVYNPLELNGSTQPTSFITLPVKLDIPIDYNGVIHILLTIYVNNTENIVQGGITQLNQFLHSYA